MSSPQNSLIQRNIFFVIRDSPTEQIAGVGTPINGEYLVTLYYFNSVVLIDKHIAPLEKNSNICIKFPFPKLNQGTLA